jgi:hypothetical protein
MRSSRTLFVLEDAREPDAVAIRGENAFAVS